MGMYRSTLERLFHGARAGENLVVSEAKSVNLVSEGALKNNSRVEMYRSTLEVIRVDHRLEKIWVIHKLSRSKTRTKMVLESKYIVRLPKHFAIVLQVNAGYFTGRG
jgi:hypothetical protein